MNTLKTRLTLIGLMILISLSIQASDNDSTTIRPFTEKEELNFKLSYGWFKIGKGLVRLSDEATDHYSVYAEGQTVGLLGIFANLNDKFYANVDTSTLQPLSSVRDIKDGRYWRHQENEFNHGESQVHVDIIDYKDTAKNVNRDIEIPNPTFDILSSYLYLRSVDWSQRNVQDSVMVNTFYGKKTYYFGVEYAGQERIKFHGKKITTYKLYILFPNSTVFPEDKPVTVWVTADENQLPLKISAKFGIGRATAELTGYKNLKVPIDYF